LTFTVQFGCAVKDAKGAALAHVYFEDEPTRRALVKIAKVADDREGADGTS
jgi:hypothetical protein